MAELNSYELSRDFFNWCFENPELIKPTHIAMYFFIIEHCNRLGWKSKFGLPMEMTKDAIGISNYKTYANTFKDLEDWGFIKVYEKSKNQYSANVIGLVKNTKATTKALSKASLKHSQKQVQSIVGIDKPINLLTKEPINLITQFFLDFENGNEIVEIARINNLTIDFVKSKLIEFRVKAELEYPNYGKFVSHFKNWLNHNKTNSGKKEYTLFSPMGRWTGFLTESELAAKTQSGYFKLQA